MYPLPPQPYTTHTRWLSLGSLNFGMIRFPSQSVILSLFRVPGSNYSFHSKLVFPVSPRSSPDPRTLGRSSESSSTSLSGRGRDILSDFEILEYKDGFTNVPFGILQTLNEDLLDLSSPYLLYSDRRMTSDTILVYYPLYPKYCEIKLCVKKIKGITSTCFIYESVGWVSFTIPDPSLRVCVPTSDHRRPWSVGRPGVASSNRERRIDDVHWRGWEQMTGILSSGSDVRNSVFASDGGTQTKVVFSDWEPKVEHR